MEVLETDLTDLRLRERYDWLFEACPRAFIQQSSYWADVIKDLGPDEPIFLLCSENGHDLGGLPLYLYRHNLGNILTSVPQPGPLGGIFLREGLSREEIEQTYVCLLGRAQQLARENECLTLTIITNPFFPDLELYERYLSPTFVLENFTQYIPLEKAGQERMSPRRESEIRRNIRKAHDAGLSVTVCETDTEFEALYRVHRQRHLETDAVPLSFQLFRNIRHILEPRHKARLQLVKSGTEIAAGCVYIYHRDILDVFVLDAHSEYAKQGANYLSTEYSLGWGRGAGVRIYNWQSSPGRENGVYHFKKQWGSLEAIYYFVTKLFCEPERIQRVGLRAVRAEYPWHYVVPYAAFQEGFDRKHFRKE